MVLEPRCDHSLSGLCLRLLLKAHNLWTIITAGILLLVTNLTITGHERLSLESIPISSEVICPNISLGVPDSKQFLNSFSILFLSTWSQLTSNGFDQFVLSSLYSMQYDSTYEINNGKNENFKIDNYKSAAFR